MTQRLCLVLLLLFSTPALAGVTLYVAPKGDDTNPGTAEGQPLASLTGARDALRRLRDSGQLEGPVTVYLREGEHLLSEPLILRPEDSGTAAEPVTFAAYPGDHPVISGARRIEGWRKMDDGLWVASIPEFSERKWNFRQLYVNGERRKRARTPNEGFFIVSGFPDGKPPDVEYQSESRRFEYAEGDLNPAWRNLGDIEVIVYHFWTDSHLPIESIDPDTRIVTFQHPAGKVFTDDFSDDGARYIVENVFEGLDQPGEWYLDRQKGELYYLPLPGEDPSQLEFNAPYVTSFLQIKGEPASAAFVENIHFRNLTFAYTHFELPQGNSNDNQASASVAAAITLEGTRNCSFMNCRLMNLGTYGFELRAGCSGNKFTRNELIHIGAGGFRLNGGTDQNHPLERTARNEISDNVIRHYGEEFPSGVGVLLQHTEGNIISHNEIHDGGYTGVSVGWSWGYQRSISRDNIIEFNHIHEIGRGVLSDMGGIYTLGVSPGTVLRNNLIHDVDAHRYGGWGIYNDEGSTHILVENNVVYDTKFAGYDIHFAREITVRNNIFACGRLQQLSRTRVEPHDSVYFENNIVYWTQGDLLDGDWSDFSHPFYILPDEESGTIEVEHTSVFDWNVYFNPNITEDDLVFGEQSFVEWRGAGKDRHSSFVDPLFVDPGRRDFRLREESPAFKMGFRSIDLEGIGPRGPVGPQ